jgi:hypothetical protein
LKKSREPKRFLDIFFVILAAAGGATLMEEGRWKKKEDDVNVPTCHRAISKS